jgi:hypothetical protein
MTVARCDLDAYYPFRSLVQGPLADPGDLPKIERFVRSVVLHDDTELVVEPLPGPPDEEEREWTEEEIAAGGRNVVVAFAPVIDQYEQLGLIRYAGEVGAEARAEISEELLEVARTAANQEEGPYFRAHFDYIRQLVATVEAGGSIVIEGQLSDRIIETASQIPQNLFARLDAGWTNMVRELDQGDAGVVVPPFLAILLNRTARRDAIPQILVDLRAEYEAARIRLWDSIRALKEARTLAQLGEIRGELQRAGELMNPAREWPTWSPLRALWQIGVGAMQGAGVAEIVGGRPIIGAAVGAANEAANEIRAAQDLDFRAIFRRGAFDLARRVNIGLRDVPRMPDLLGPLVSDAERESLGLG